MNKGRRNELTQLKYKKRIKRWTANCGIFVDQDGQYNYNPSSDYFIKNNLYTEFKNSSVLCSCWMCSGEWKYKRHLKKQEDMRLIQEALEEGCA